MMMIRLLSAWPAIQHGCHYDTAKQIRLPFWTSLHKRYRCLDYVLRGHATREAVRLPVHQDNERDCCFDIADAVHGHFLVERVVRLLLPVEIGSGALTQVVVSGERPDLRAARSR